MEDNKSLENQESENKEEANKGQEEQKKETAQDDKSENKEEVKETDKQEEKKETSEYADMKERLRVLEESNKLQAEQLNSEKVKNTLMEKVQDKELQKTIMGTGLVKSVEDIDMVMKIVELSKTLNKSKFTDGYKPTDEVLGDAYQQAQAKGDIFGMIKQKMSKQ